MSSDRRVRYTKMVLCEALIKFMKEKPLSRITIKEICEHADINRTTYYAHYTDQFDQLRQIEAEFIENINSYLDDFEPGTGGVDLLEMVVRIFEYIKQNEELCRVLLGPNGDLDFQAHVIGVMSERVLGVWSGEKPRDPFFAENALVFIAFGSIGVIKSWLSNSGGRSPREIAKLVVNLADHGVGMM